MRITKTSTTRHAITLVEVMVVTSVATILMGIAIALLLSLRNWDRDMRHRTLRNDQMSRLYESMRADIRRASDVSMPSTNAILIRGAGGARTQYDLTPRGCLRTVSVPGAATPQNELFNVGVTREWKLDRSPAGRRPLVVVTLVRADPDTDAPLAPFILQAIVGGDSPSIAP